MNTKTSKESEEKAQKFSPELLDELLGEAKTAQELLGSSGVIKSLSKALLGRMLEGKLSHHLGYEKYDAVGKNSGNSRNGRSKKTLKGEFGELDLAVPRDRQAAFEPVLIPKYETRFAEFGEKIVSLYARGVSDRDIAAQVGELYGVEVSHGLITGRICSDVRSHGVAEASFGGGLSDCLLRRFSCEGKARETGGKETPLPRLSYQRRGGQGTLRHGVG